MFLDLDNPVASTNPAMGTCRKCGASIRLSYYGGDRVVSVHSVQKDGRPLGRCEGTFHSPK